MNKPRKLAALALGLSLGLAGFGPVALAHRNGEPEPEAEAAESCSTTQANESSNSTGDSSQSGLINLNNVAVQGNNLDVLGNLLCQGVFANDIVAGVLGFAEGGDSDGDGDGDAAGCTTSQENGSDNSTGDSEQEGLVNAGNVAVQGNNIGVGGNALCGSSFLNDVVAGILGFAEGGDGDASDEGGAEGCTTDQSTDSTNETGDTLQGGLANVNNIAVQGNNIDALGNALCDGNFLNGLTAGILGTAIQGDDDGDDDGDDEAADCATSQENGSENATGDTLMGGLLNLNNLAVQGNNVAVLSNGLCGSVFLNDVLVSILGIVG
jgi:Leucine-rich repeat (LRR) protein